MLNATGTCRSDPATEWPSLQPYPTTSLSTCAYASISLFSLVQATPRPIWKWYPRPLWRVSGCAPVFRCRGLHEGYSAAQGCSAAAYTTALRLHARVIQCTGLHWCVCASVCVRLHHTKEGSMPVTQAGAQYRGGGPLQNGAICPIAGWPTPRTEGCHPSATHPPGHPSQQIALRLAQALCSPLTSAHGIVAQRSSPTA